MPDDNGGAVAVGLMALQDRVFFAALLENPAAAIAAKQDAGLLAQVTPAEVQMVAAAIEERLSRGGPDPLEMWDRYHLTGEWRLRDWVGEWGDLRPHE